MEMLWFFQVWSRQAYDSAEAHESDFRFSPGHKRSFDSNYDPDSVASENHP